VRWSTTIIMESNELDHGKSMEIEDHGEAKISNG
jgi:hypothetical protein